MTIAQTAASFAVLYAVAFLVAAALWPMPLLVCALSLVLAALLVALSAVDAKWFVLPNLLTLSLAASGLTATLLVGMGSATLHVASGVLAGGLLMGLNAGYRHFRGQDGLGGGDAKLLAGLGLWLGPWGLPTVLLWACLTALSEILTRLGLSQRLCGTSRIPFGPHLAFGGWLVWLFGPLQ